MNIFKKILGKKPVSPLPEKICADVSPQSQQPPEDLRNDPNYIGIFDKYGHEMFIKKEEWGKNVLPGVIQSHWNEPAELYDDIIMALNDGFYAKIVDAAKHLFEMDSNYERGACVWGIVLMKNGRLDEAEKVFRDFTGKHGESGVILTNLAKVIGERGGQAESEAILWHALEVDPNLDNGFGWYVAIHREREGEDAARDAMRRVAAIPASWLAQIWLARDALEKKDKAQAMALYGESLSRVGTPTPGDLLMQISGDLGIAGHIPEILQLIEPRFDVKVHGLAVGNNLIKAHVDLGHQEEAERILEQLYAQNRPDWRESLSFWDTEIAKARNANKGAPTKDKLKVGMLEGEGPIWLKQTSPAVKLFHTKSGSCPLVCILSGTVETMPGEQNNGYQLADTRGRLSRAIPLFFAEQVELKSCAKVRTLVPWISEPSGGFALFGRAYTEKDAAELANQGPIQSQYIVTTHLKTQTEPWTAEVRLIQADGEKCLSQHTVSLSSASPTAGVLRLAQELLDALNCEAGIRMHPVPPAYALPEEAGFPYYLLRLEQLLAVRCSNIDGVAPGFLNGARDIIDGNIDLCLQTPQSINVRLLLAQTLLSMKHNRPDILTEFAERVRLLQNEHPLSEEAQGIVQGIIDEAFAK